MNIPRLALLSALVFTLSYLLDAAVVAVAISVPATDMSGVPATDMSSSAVFGAQAAGASAKAAEAPPPEKAVSASPRM